MIRRTPIYALLLLLAVNAVVLAGVAWNRSAPPEGTIVLTERELPLNYSYSKDENSGVSLSLNWHRDNRELDWFDADKLAELGFDETILNDGVDDDRFYRTLPKQAFVVLEYDGRSWSDYVEQQKELIAALPGRVAKGELQQDAADKQQKRIEIGLQLATRLFAVDVGPDADALRQRYPDTTRYLILRAAVRAVVDWDKRGQDSKAERRVVGNIDQILIYSIHVPRPFHETLAAIPGNERLYPGYSYFNPDSKQRVHYQVHLSLGKRHEPWITAIGPYPANP